MKTGWRPFVACVLALLAVAPAATQQRPASANSPNGSSSAVTSATAPPARCADGTSSAKAGGCEGPALRLLYGSRLPLWITGKTYGPIELVKGGKPPYTIDWLRDGRPPRLEFDATKGTLFSVELGIEAKPYNFTVEVTDKAEPPQKVRQTFQLVVGRPPPEPAARPASAPLPLDVAPRNTVVVYRLTKDDIEALAPPEPLEPASGGLDSDPATTRPQAQGTGPTKAPELAAPDPLFALLRPLQDVEFTSRRQFESALRARRCIYLDETRKVGTGPACDFWATAHGTPAAEGRLPELRANTPAAERKLFDELLPPSTHARVLEKARKPYPLSRPDRFELDHLGCGCVPRAAGNDIAFGFLPRWHVRRPTPKIDFSLLHRLSMMGVGFNDRGVIARPDSWRHDADALSRLAARHDTRLDLVLHRADWHWLQKTDPKELPSVWTELARHAANEIAVESDLIKHELQPLLWRGVDRRVFSGITVYFENTPTGDFGELGSRYQQFFKGFMDKLFRALEERRDKHQPLSVNIVAPGEHFGANSPYRSEELLEWVQRAKKNPQNNITVRLLVQLHEPTTYTKKIIRQRLDRSAEPVTGYRRRQLLESIVPILYLPDPAIPPPPELRTVGPEQAASAPVAPPAQRLSKGADEQLDDDLAYYRWSYSGVALWSLPVQGQGAGHNILGLLWKNYSELRQPWEEQAEDLTLPKDWQDGTAFRGPAPRLNDKICAFTCTERGGVRLAAEVLSALTLGMFLAYQWISWVRRRGRSMWAAIIVSLLLTGAVWLALLFCDPSLAEVRKRNDVLVALLAIAAVVLLWFSFKKRVPVP